MKEVIFEKLGYFTETEAKKLKAALQGRTYLRFEITWSNHAGNCILIVRSREICKEEDLKNLFLHCVLSLLARGE